ncbi:KN motif and ankyrin repeat domain-containing protein 4 [Pelodytes ibericus]
MEKTNGEDVQSKTEKKENRMSYSVETPYGFHLDLDFLKYVHDIEKGNTIKRIHIHRRAKQSKFSTLPRNFSVPDSGSTESRTWSPGRYKADAKDSSVFSPSESSLRLRYVHELNYRRKENVFDAPKPMGDISPEDFSSWKGRPQFARASSMPAALPQCTMSSDQNQYLKLPQPNNSLSTSGLPYGEGPAYIDSDNQITAALKRIQDLEEQIKKIPEMKHTISVLEDNNNQLTTQLKSLSQLLASKDDLETAELSILESDCKSEATAMENGERSLFGQLPSADINLSLFSDIERQVTDLKAELQESAKKLQSLQASVEKQNNDIKSKDTHIAELRDLIEEMEDTINKRQEEQAHSRDMSVNTEEVEIRERMETCDKSTHASITVETQSVGCDSLMMDLLETRIDETCESALLADETSCLPTQMCFTMDITSEENLVGHEGNLEEPRKWEETVGHVVDNRLETKDSQDQLGVSETTSFEGEIVETRHCPTKEQAPPDASVGQYVKRIQDLLQEQWTCLESGYPDLASAIKQPASKLSSIQNQLVNSLNVLSSVYSTQTSSDKQSSETGIQQTAEASPQRSLKSIMKKKSSRSAGHEAHAKKNLQFVGVNGGYETTSSEDSSSSEEFCGADSEKGEVQTHSQDGGNDQMEGSPESKEEEPEEATGPAAFETQQNVRRCSVGGNFRRECQILSSRLAELQTTTDNQLRQSLYTVCQEWFRVSSQKSSHPDLVVVYLEELKSISPHLLQMVVNIADENGNTALHYSVSHSNFGIVKLLLDTGVCDVDHQNKAGYTPVMLTPLASAETDEDMEVVLELLNSGNLNLCATQGGQTALILGVSHGRSDMVKVLLHCGADVNLQDKDGDSALMVACQLGNLGIVKLLVSQPQCDIELTNKEGDSALSIVLKSAHTEIAEFLQAYTDQHLSCPSTRPEEGASL